MSILERVHLVILREVERHGSLTAAANQLNLSQSALSHTIRKLEDQLGVAVWHREGRKLRLTQAGDYLLTVANRVIPQLNHAEDQLKQYAQGERGTLCIGMECHPCYQWLLKVVAPYFAAWPSIDVDVKQKFQFGGIAALFSHEIDILVTPDPLYKPGLWFEPVFDYELVLVVPPTHSFSRRPSINPDDLIHETLITYPVALERLDIYTQFLSPAGITPKHHKSIETTDIMLQMVASGRGVAALPSWLVQEYTPTLAVSTVRLGQTGIAKQIFLGGRKMDHETNYLRAFVELAHSFNSICSSHASP